MDETTVQDRLVKCDTMRQFSVAATWILLLAMCISPVSSASVVHRPAPSHCQDAVTQPHGTACGYPPCRCDKQVTASEGKTALGSPVETTLGYCVNRSPTQPDCPPDCWCHSDRNLPSLPAPTVSLSPVVSVCQANSETRCLSDAQMHELERLVREPSPAPSAHSRCVSMCRLVL